MSTATAPIFTRDDMQATDSFARIELVKVSLTGIMWREHRRQTAMHTAVLIHDKGECFCYAGDALRIARYTNLKVYDSVFAAKKVETVRFPIAQIGEVLAALLKAGINTLVTS